MKGVTVNRAEELAKQAQERAAAYQQAARCKVMQSDEADGGILNAQTSGDFPGKGHGATPEQWPDGACGCGVRGIR